ncbi:MAG: bifunctional RNase H/acid phosphatase [Jatrophihabitantaceae bacterium]
MTADRVVIEADGGARGNPGPAGYGAVVLAGLGGEVLAERSEFIGAATNNVAEYRGLIAGLDAARELGAREVAVRMDSKLVVEQMSGRWKVKNEGLRALFAEAVQLRRAFADVSFEWIPREQNKHADRLANEAMDRGTGKVTAPTRAGADRPDPLAWAPHSGPSTRLILVRHGATSHSAEMRFSGRNDLELDDVGERQAAALAERAASFGPVAALVSSPLRRSRQTADAIATTLHLPVLENDDFAEVDFGRWEGMTIADVAAANPRELARWRGSPEIAPPNGESLAALEARVRRGRDSVLATDPLATVVVVTHVSPIKALIRMALDAPPDAVFRMHLDVASVSMIDYRADGTPSMRLFNDTSHLAGVS